MNKNRTDIQRAIFDLLPFDEQEKSHQTNALAWVDSKAPLFRIEKPDKPPKHLVSYFVPVDLESNSLLLIDHIKAGLWLPPGGHVEPGEHPCETVQREMLEELNTPAHFATPLQDKPLFITVTATRGPGKHTDVSLWYVVALSSRNEINYDTREFSGYRWSTFDEVMATPASTLDPHMHRFTAKLQACLERESNRDARPLL